MNNTTNYNEVINYHGSKIINRINFLIILIAAIAQIHYLFIDNSQNHELAQNKLQITIFSIIFPAITILLYLIFFRMKKIKKKSYFTSLFLLSTFTLLISWRLSSLGEMGISRYIYLLAFILDIINYIICGYNDIQDAKTDKNNNKNIKHNTKFEWQLFFVRMTIGFIFVPHFTEKLFAGSVIRADDIIAFTQLGVPNPVFFVFFAGLIELACCFSIGCGFLTRLGSFGAFVYLLVASFLGKHFTLGFIWASTGGGWEYPALWSVLIVSFTLFGANSFSLDRVLKDHFKLPKFIRFLMG